jgi:ribose transport system ATP-binding protein
MIDPILTLQSVGKRFPGIVALNDVTFEIARGEGHVLLGENGAGKSTLIKLLAGIITPTDGEITFDGHPYRPRSPTDAYRAGIRVVHQELSMLSHMTVAENLLFESLPQRHGMVNYRAMNRRAAELLADVGLDISPTTIVSRLGVGEMQLVEIAKALCHDSKLLILDEPTATLTDKEVQRLFEILHRLKARQVTTLYISHRLPEIYEIGDRVTILRDGRHVATRPVKGLSIPDIVQMMVGHSIQEDDAFRADVKVSGTAMRVDGLQLSKGAPQLSFSVGHGEIVGIAGLVGSGRTEAMRALFGADPKVAGRIEIDGAPVEIASPRDAVAHGLCLLTEDRKEQGLLLDMSCAENMTITHLDKVSSHGLLRREAERQAADALVADLRVKTPSVDYAVRNFSGGNQQKVVLAKWLFRGSKVLICDEPTRGIDVGAKAEIYGLLWDLAAADKGVLVVSSDLPELLSICHRILVFAKGRILGEVARPDFNQRKILSLAYEEYDLEQAT